MASTAVVDGSSDPNQRRNQLLFWGCFASLIATAFGFQVRAMLMETWGTEFNIDKTQQGEIFGAGLWPFAIICWVWNAWGTVQVWIVGGDGGMGDIGYQNVSKLRYNTIIL